MTDTKISGLPAAASANDAMEIPVNDSGTTKKVTRAQLISSAARILGSSGTPASLTGTISETQLAAVTVPAGLMGVAACLRITYFFSATSNANNKTLNLRFSGASGTIYNGPSITSQTGYGAQTNIFNKNAANSQKAATGFGFSTGAFITSAVDTTVATTIYISGTLANSGDTMTLESYTVEFIPAV